MSNPVRIDLAGTALDVAGAFSPNSEKLYVGDGPALVQCDVTGDSAAVAASRDTVAANPYPDAPDQWRYPDFQVAPDGKLYLIPHGIDVPYLGAVNCPDEPADQCQFVAQAVTLAPGTFAQYSLPRLNQTLFRNAGVLQATASRPARCTSSSDSLQLFAFGAGADSFLWSPAEGLSDPTAANPRAFPAQTTTYTVTASGPCFSGDTSLTVQVLPPPALALPDTLPRCDNAPLLLDPGGSPA